MNRRALPIAIACSLLFPGTNRAEPARESLHLPQAALKESLTFIGKRWGTERGSHFLFLADGSGIQSNAAGKEWPIHWTMDGKGLVTVEGWADDQKATLYFQFTGNKEGVFGSSPDKLDRKLRVE